MKIIIGLGNPGEKYKTTRHNVGWLFLDNLLGEVNWKEEKKFNALTYRENDTIFVKPLTFMNESGYSTRKILDYYNLIPKKFNLFKKSDSDLSDVLYIIQDDLDIDLGKYKISKDSGSAGHNGIKSIIKHLKTKKFTRLRIGIKNDLLRTKIPAEKFVLQRFDKDEENKLKPLFESIDIKNI